MKYYKLDKQGEELLRQYDKGAFKSVPGFTRQKTFIKRLLKRPSQKPKT